MKLIYGTLVTSAWSSGADGSTSVMLGMELGDSKYSGCWNAAVDEVMSDPKMEQSLQYDKTSTCAQVDDVTKANIAFRMLLCHYESAARLSKLFVIGSSCGNHIIDDPKGLRTVPLDKRPVCLEDLSDSAFEIYTEFLNHFDNLCYFYISQAWYRQLTGAVDSLVETSKAVVSNLQDATKDTKLLIEGQMELREIGVELNHESAKLHKDIIKHNESLANMVESHMESVVAKSSQLGEMLDRIMEYLFQIIDICNDLYGFVTHTRYHIGYALSCFAIFYFGKKQRTKVQMRLLLIALVAGYSYLKLDELTNSQVQLVMGISAVVMLVHGWWTHETDVDKLRASLEDHQRVLTRMQRGIRSIPGYFSPTNKPRAGRPQTPRRRSVLRPGKPRYNTPTEELQNYYWLREPNSPGVVRLYSTGCNSSPYGSENSDSN